MIGELVALAIVVVLPASIMLGALAMLGLGIAGFAFDPNDRHLLRR
ncbi:MAG: hypothetical protein ACRDIL_09185 [Candidatus Limnocylindrales bacterium]